MTTLAIVHPTHLVATELRESLDRRRELWQRMTLLSTSEDEIGTLTEVRGEAAMVAAIDDHAFDGVDVAFFFGSAESYKPLLDTLPETTTAVLMTEDSGASDGLPIVAGINLDQVTQSSTLSSPHPAAIALALLLQPLADLGPKHLSVTVVQPASVYGNAGLDELLEQTNHLLSFKTTEEEQTLPKDLAFNLFEAAGGPAGLVNDLKAVLAQTTMGEAAGELDVSCQVLQAGIFHGYGLSVHVQLETDPGVDGLCKALDSSAFLDLDVHPHRFGPKEAVAKDVLLVGAPRSTGEGRYSLWVSLDNLTLGGAMNAISMLEALSPELEGH